MKKLVFAALVAAAAAGCASHGVRVTEQQLAQIKVGETTWSDMIAILGQPTGTSFNSNGQRFAVYGYAQATARPETFIPFVGPFVGGADMKSNSVVLIFGRDGRLASWSGNASETGMGMGLASGVAPERTPNQPKP